MILSAFDTGDMTGCVLIEFTSEGNILSSEYRTVIAQDLDDVADDFIHRSNRVIIERIPVSSTPKLHVIQNKVFVACDKHNKEFTLIFPGMWKPFVKKATNWTKTVKSQHVQDAFNMLRYHVLFEHGFQLGDLHE